MNENGENAIKMRRTQLSKAQAGVLSLLDYALFSAPAPDIAEEDWEGIRTEAAAQKVLPLIYFAAADGSVRTPDPSNVENRAAWERLKRQAYETFLKNNRKFRDHARVHDLMEEAQIPYVILKGCVSAAAYPRPILRTMGDVDLFVQKEALAPAGDIFRREGYHEKDHAKVKHDIFVCRGRSQIELHFALPGLPQGEKRALADAWFADLISESRMETIEGATMRCPSLFHHGLILLFHSLQHLTDAGFGLRHLLDWLLFVEGLSDECFLAMYEEKLRAIGLFTYAQVLTCAGTRWFSARPKPWAEATEAATVDALVLDILNGGDFGVKDAQRFNQGYLLSGREEGGVSARGSLSQFISSYNGVVRRQFSPAKRHAWLLPVGWAVIGTKHLRQVLRGERSGVELGKLLSGAKKRRNTYRALHLYEGADGE